MRLAGRCFRGLTDIDCLLTRLSAGILEGLPHIPIGDFALVACLRERRKGLSDGVPR
jgi:hypothetical protein